MDASHELPSPNRNLTLKTLEVRSTIIAGLMGYELTSTHTVYSPIQIYHLNSTSQNYQVKLQQPSYRHMLKPKGPGLATEALW